MKKKRSAQPAALKSCVDYIDVQGGRFKVSRNGEVIRVKNGDMVFAPITAIGRSRKYMIVSYCEYGDQKSYYVHRLVAEAFLRNPNNYPEVNHIDGNPSNNHVDNLEWCTRRQNTQHAYKIGLMHPMKNAKPCESCGEMMTHAKSGVCHKCRLNKKADEKRTKAYLSRVHSVTGISVDLLPENHRNAVELRSKGMSLRQIGKELGISGERARQLIKKSKEKAGGISELNLNKIKMSKILELCQRYDVTIAELIAKYLN